MQWTARVQTLQTRLRSGNPLLRVAVCIAPLLFSLFVWGCEKAPLQAPSALGTQSVLFLAGRQVLQIEERWDEKKRVLFRRSMLPDDDFSEVLVALNQQGLVKSASYKR